ncbi:MAG: phosphoribosylformylglycinamidine synthase subunit PurL [Planctomycetes bacterium]|nr:phosphoribosylformylglycinamidine synthase subunit PurL [Planctomycetota bacterium]
MSATQESSATQRSLSLPDAWRVEVFRKPGVDDPDGAHLLAAARELGVDALRSARAGRGTLLPPTLSESAVQAIVRELLADPVLDDVRLTAPQAAPETTPGKHRVLVARRAGVMDPVALTISRVIARAKLAAADLHVSTFTAWELEGDLDAAALETLASKSLANEVIEDVRIDGEGLHYGPPAKAKSHGRVEVPLAGLDDAALLRVSIEGGLSLNLVEMKTIVTHYAELGRAPSACELETIAQTWSEHCKHKTFAGIVEMREDGELRKIDNLLKTTIKRATDTLAKDWCISVFHDNAGIIAFEEDWDVCFKVETHNHPSAIDPYGGAGTGIGGVIRDILGVGMGARPIANTDAFFVGPLDLPASEVPKGCMHPRRILRGVVHGVRDYGNRMGIPTVNGGVWVHDDYIGNPLVYAGTVGLMPRWAAHKSVEPGDAIVVVGGRTGRDGIHGATFSSIELHEESEMVSAAAVQIGDPITEKRVLDVLLQARDKRLYRGITDCGAGGLSSAVGEMGEDCGAVVHLERVPLKYPGLTPEEIWISEAQERMVLSVPQASLAECLAVFASEDVEATVIGEFTSSGKLELFHAGEPMCELEMSFLHDGTPRPSRQAVWDAPRVDDPGCPAPRDHEATLLALLGAPDIASKEWIVRQYDHEVQGMSVVKPFVGEASDGPGNGTVLRPLATSNKGIAITCGANPHYGRLDPRRMALAAIDEALRNSVAVGGDPDHTAILDNFSWGNCDKPDRLGALVLAAEACHDAALAYGTPFISGKDSLNNEYRVGDETIAIPPTLLISALAMVPDVRRAQTMDLKGAGNYVYLVGRTKAELGGSHYAKQRGANGGTVPAPDLADAPRILRRLHAAIAAGTTKAVHDLSEGGLAVAAAETAFSGGFGLELDLAQAHESGFGAGFDDDSVLLYSESCTRFLVEVAPEQSVAFERALDGVPLARLGRTVAEPELRILGRNANDLVRIPLADLKAAHQSGFHG